MKIIFLDMDGVMVTGLIGMEGEARFNHEAVAALNLILEKSNAEIVLSSSWRRVYSIEEMNKLFKKNGIKKEIIDFTPTLNKLRQDEILDWLAKNRDKEIESFVIIDDDVSSLRDLSAYSVFTLYFSDGGLKKDHVEQVLEILNAKYP